jgi:hypothetical protein
MVQTSLQQSASNTQSQQSNLQTYPLEGQPPLQQQQQQLPANNAQQPSQPYPAGNQSVMGADRNAQPQPYPGLTAQAGQQQGSQSLQPFPVNQQQPQRAQEGQPPMYPGVGQQQAGGQAQPYPGFGQQQAGGQPQPYPGFGQQQAGGQSQQQQGQMYAQPEQYTIKSGDTFDAIAAMKGTTAKVLEALNPGIVATDLGVGTVMNLPGQGSYPLGQQQQPFPPGQLQSAMPFASGQGGQPQIQSQQVTSAHKDLIGGQRSGSVLKFPMLISV